MQLSGTRNRHDPRLLGKQPGERDLSKRCLLPYCDLAQRIDQRQIRLPRLRRKARDDVAEVGTVERRFLIDLSREEALPRGLNATNPMPSSSSVGSTSSSGRLHHSEYSFWTAVTRWTACARRIVCTPGSDLSRCFHLRTQFRSLCWRSQAQAKHRRSE